jgi:hypothetical protein
MFYSVPVRSGAVRENPPLRWKTHRIDRKAKISSMMKWIQSGEAAGRSSQP